MLRHLFLFVPFLLLVDVASAVALPHCPGSYDKTTWTNCEGTRIFASGDKYVDEYRGSQEHGQGTFTFAHDFRFNLFGRNPAGMKTIGEFANGLPNGNVILYWANGDVWVGRVRNDANGPEWLGGKKYTADNIPPDLVRK